MAAANALEGHPTTLQESVLLNRAIAGLFLGW